MTWLFVKDIWEKGNGIPKSYLRIQEQFDGLYRTCFRCRCEGRGSKNSHKKKITGVLPKKPTRRSNRYGESQLISTLHVGAIVTDTEEADFVVAEPEEEPSVRDTSPPTKKLRSSGRLTLENPHKDVWMKDIGSKLFNVRSSHCLNKINICKKNEIPETFDSECYLDQLDPSKRKKFIHVTNVTKECMEEAQQKQLKLARKSASELSTRGGQLRSWRVQHPRRKK